MNTAAPSSPAEAKEQPRARLSFDSLRSGSGVAPLLALLILWMLYMVSGFRIPTDPILVSDSNAGSAIRQILFAAGGALAVGRLVQTGTLGSLLVLRAPMSLLLLLVLGSVLWSSAPSVTVKRSILFVFGWFAISVAVQSSHRPARVFLVTLVAFTAAVAAASLAGYAVLPRNCTENPARPGLAGIAIHPNTLAPFMSIGLLLSAGLSPRQRIRRVALWMARTLLATALLLTFSVTTWLTTAVGAAIYIFLSVSTFRRGCLQVAAVLACLIIAVVGVSTIRSAFFEATGRDESLSGRGELWAVVRAKCAEEPLLGLGYGAFWTEGKGRELVQTWNPRQSHHAYLDVMVDLGTVGLLAVFGVFHLGLLVGWLRHSGLPGTQQRRAVAAMIAVACAYISVYAFGQSFFLRFDAFPFFVLAWIVTILGNPDTNGLAHEFSCRDDATANG